MADYFTEREKAEAEYAATNTVRADFISRQKAIDWMKNEWDGMVVSVFDGIEHLPSADVVKVVRCKDCENYQTDWKPHFNDRHYCAVMDSFMPVDGFCNYGERKDGNV